MKQHRFTQKLTHLLLTTTAMATLNFTPLALGMNNGDEDNGRETVGMKRQASGANDGRANDGRELKSSKTDSSANPGRFLRSTPISGASSSRPQASITIPEDYPHAWKSYSIKDMFGIKPKDSHELYPWMNALEDCFLDPNFNSQSFARTMNDLSKWGNPRDVQIYLSARPQWLEKFLDISKSKLGQFNSQDFSNTIHGLGKMGVTVPQEWVDVFLGASQSKLGQFEPQALSNTIHGLGKLGATLPQYWVKAFLGASQSKLERFETQHLSNTIHGLGKLGATLPQDWVKAFLDASQSKLGRFETQHLSNTIHGLGKLGATVPQVWVDAFLGASQSKLEQFETQHLSNTIHGLGKLGATVPQEWVDAFLGASQSKLGQFNAQDFSNTIHGLGKLGVTVQQDWVKAFLDASQNKLGQFNAQDFSNTIHGLVLLDCNPGNTWLNDWCQAWFKVDNKTTEDWHQVAVAQSYYHHVYHVKMGVQIPSNFLNVLGIEFPTTSQFQKNVEKLLRQTIGDTQTVESEHWIPEIFAPVDLYVSNRNLIIQVDGPFHFLSDDLTYDGPTQFQTRFLEKLSYRVKRISVRDWDDVQKKSPEDQKKWAMEIVGDVVGNPSGLVNNAQTSASAAGAGSAPSSSKPSGAKLKPGASSFTPTKLSAAAPAWTPGQ